MARPIIYPAVAVVSAITSFGVYPLVPPAGTPVFVTLLALVSAGLAAGCGRDGAGYAVGLLCGCLPLSGYVVAIPFFLSGSFDAALTAHMLWSAAIIGIPVATVGVVFGRLSSDGVEELLSSLEPVVTPVAIAVAATVVLWTFCSPFGSTCFAVSVLG